MEQIREIVDLELNRIRTQLTEQQIKLEIDDETKDFIAAKGYDPTFGARPLRRVIQNMIEDPLAEALLQGKFRAGRDRRRRRRRRQARPAREGGGVGRDHRLTVSRRFQTVAKREWGVRLPSRTPLVVPTELLSPPAR